MSNKSYDRPLEHKEYLKLKYLSGTVEQQKEKKKKIKTLKNVFKTKKIRIFDDDIDLKAIDGNGSDDEIYYGTKEEKPTVAAVVDERPLHMRRNDIDTNRWKTIGSHEEDVDNRGIIKSETIDSNNSEVQSRKSIDLNKKSKNTSKQSHSHEDLLQTKESNNKNSTHDSDSDLSPIRLEVRKDDSKAHSSKSRRHDSDSDLSPPRTKSKTISSSKAKRHDSDSDLSPPRETKYSSKSDRQSRYSRNYSQHESNDLSPQRSRPVEKHSITRTESKTYSDSDSDLSPPRAQEDSIHSNKKTNETKRSKTLAGKKSGLSDAKELRNELLSVKKKEQHLFASISDEMLGKNAKTVYRDSKSGKIRNLEEELRLKLKEDSIKEKIDSEKKAKYEKWSKGLTQTEQQEERLQSDLHEMTKPLARYEDDTDLDKLLREREREDDPMLATIRKNKAKHQTNSGDKSTKVRPTYNGPTPPMNRFKIMPGYRWDGVDRSNGFEKKYFERISNKESAVEEAYRWSTQDM